MISFDHAIEIIEAAARPFGTEAVALSEAAGRVLASPVIAAIDSPRADVSAMDGYAVRSADLSEVPVALRVVGKSFPGSGYAGLIDHRECVRIFTGAPLPTGADRIVIQEQVRVEGDLALIEVTSLAPLWVRARGADFRVNDAVLEPGRILNAAALIAAGGADAATVDVFHRPRLTLLTTGDELVSPGEARESALAVPDSVSLGLALLAEQWGATIVRRERMRDDLPGMEAIAERSVGEADVVVLAGGASVGERDYAKAMFEPLGLQLGFSKISMRPGKPAWFGTAAGAIILGLPGNPTSALVAARLLLCPLLACLTGRGANAALFWEDATLATPLRDCDDRETFHRARLTQGSAALLSFQESHAQKALAEADILLRQPARSGSRSVGETASVLRF